MGRSAQVGCHHGTRVPSRSLGESTHLPVEGRDTLVYYIHGRHHWREREGSMHCGVAGRAWQESYRETLFHAGRTRAPSNAGYSRPPRAGASEEVRSPRETNGETRPTTIRFIVAPRNRGASQKGGGGYQRNE